MTFTNSSSTIGIQQYDSRFDAGFHGGIKHTYTWPRRFPVLHLVASTKGILEFELHEQFVPQNLSPGVSAGQLSTSLYEEPKLMPVYSRSLSSSPPRGNLTTEQRELKRQRDHARRDSKTRMRRERSTSNPYVISEHTSPDLIPRTLPEYANSLTPSPLLSHRSLQSSPATQSASFLTTYTPQIDHLNDQGAPDMYGPVFTM